MAENMEDIHWPPRSPYEALISSPSGRKKAQEMLHRRRHARPDLGSPNSTPNSRSRANQLLDEDDYGPDDDEDEETLQLKLAAIEARLKLKRLQRNKAKSNPSAVGPRPSSSDSSHLTPKPSIEQKLTSPSKRSTTNQGREATGHVQIPLSPIKKLERAVDPVSPRLAQLGIGKGLRGGDISLKWQASARPRGRPDSSSNRQATGATPRGGTDGSRAQLGTAARNPPPKAATFSERLLEQRAADKAKRDKTQQLRKSRSTAFSIDRKELEAYQAAASEPESNETSTRPPSDRRRQNAAEFSREDVVSSYNRPHLFTRPTKPAQNSENIAPTASSGVRASSHARNAHTTAPEIHHTSSALPPERTGNGVPDPSKFEAFSGLHLSKRILPHSYLQRTLASAKPMRIPDLLRTIKPPSFDPPETEGDYVVFGVVASKSSPRDHKEKPNSSTKEKDPYDDGSNNSSKYMVLTLTDLKWSIDLFLFSTAFPRYYRLSPGTLIAILNPSIMPPPPHKIDTNAFSLTVSSSDDIILEIGTAGDIGFCKSVKKDGKVCESWVDARKTEFCDFHVDLQLKKTKAQRMGVNSGTGILGDRGGRARGGRKFGDKGSGDGGPSGLLTEGAVYDRATGSTYYVAASAAGRVNHAGGFGRGSAASLIDADDPFCTPGGLQRGGAKEERFRRRVADEQRERDIAKHLGQLKSVGSEYLRADQSKSSGQSSGDPHTKGGSNSQDGGRSGLETFGLVHSRLKAQDVKLGRSKKRSLEADRGTPKAAHTPKKTRFVTPKGIREAGRESLGDTMDGLTAHNDDCDDDDLDII